MMRKTVIFFSGLLLSASFAQAKAESTCMPLFELYGTAASKMCQKSCGSSQTECYFDPADSTKSLYVDPNCSVKCTSPAKEKTGQQN